MKSKLYKILKTLFFIELIVIMTIPTFCFASSGKIDVDSITIEENRIEDLKPMFEDILGFVQVFGSAISVIAIVVIGIRYIWSSIEEKAEIKQTAIYYIIGAILVFSTVNILAIAYDIFW